MAKIQNDGTWFVQFPTYKYVENVKSLARKNDLRVVDIRYQGDMLQCAKPPKLTIDENFMPTETPLAKALKRIEELEKSKDK